MQISSTLLIISHVLLANFVHLFHNTIHTTYTTHLSNSLTTYLHLIRLVESLIALPQSSQGAAVLGAAAQPVKQCLRDVQVPVVWYGVVCV